MKRGAYCVFETALGWCGIAWRERGESGARKASAPPLRIAEVIEKIRKHLQGEIQDFRDIAIDLDGADRFARQVYEAAREIPAGETRTYGELAKALGQTGDARDVGQALARNPIALIIPCHRVVAAGGKPGGFSAHGGRATKARMLGIEGATKPDSFARDSGKVSNQLAFNYSTRS